jgi:hypothetical protein
MVKAWILFVPLLLASCAAPYVSRREAPEEELAARREIVQRAQELLGAKDLKSLGHGFKNDCSGFVHGVYQMSGRRIGYRHLRRGRSLSESLYRTLLDRSLTFSEWQPNPGDAAFFWNTVASSGTREGITHVALVEEVGSDGTVTLIHYSSGKVNRMRMNLRQPRERTDSSGRVINDYLRRSESGSPRRDYLAGNLFAAYGDLFRHAGR